MFNLRGFAGSAGDFRMLLTLTSGYVLVEA